MGNDTRTATGYTEGFTPYAQVPKWVLRDPELSHGAVRLYGVIMSYADNATRFAFPSRETLAANMGVSVRSIGNYISELENRKMVKVDHRRNKRTGNYYSNSYTLVFQDPTQDSPEETECPRRAETECPLTRPTNKTITTSSIAFDHKIEPKPLSPSPSGDGHTLSKQLGTSKEVTRYLIDIVLAIYNSGERWWNENSYWVELETAFEEYLDLEAGDAIANRGWDARLEKIMRDNLHVGERYAASVYLGMLHNYVRSH